jgi:hypothetical protein
VNALRTPRRRRGVLVLACCALAAVLSACGSSSSSSSNVSSQGADPASAVPASALAYIQADVRPGGSLAQSIDAASKRLLGISDPGSKLVAMIDKSMASGSSYETDVSPWLGQQAAVAVLAGTTRAKAEFAVVLDQTDTAKARAATKNSVLFGSRSGPSDTLAHASYRGVSYTEDLTAPIDVGVVGDYVVLASDAAAFDAIVDTYRGAASLAASSGFKQAVSAELAGADGVAYVPLFRLLDALIPAAGTQSSTAAQILQELRTRFANAILSGSARFDSSGAAIDLAVSGAGSSGSSSSGEANPIGTLPGGSWLAVGLTNVGPSLGKLFTELGQLGSSGSSGSFTSSLREIQQVTGVNIEGDLQSITTAGLFAKGSNFGTLEAALVLSLKDPSRAPMIVSQLDRLAALISTSDHAFSVGPLSQTNIQSGFTIQVPNVPFTFDVAAGGGRVVVALGTTSLNDALASSGRLSATSGYSTATADLGSGIQPDAIIDLPAIVALLKNLGAASGATASKALPYLERLGTVALGSGTAGGERHVRIVVSGS